jgi:hypothetical protein
MTWTQSIVRIVERYFKRGIPIAVAGGIPVSPTKDNWQETEGSAVFAGSIAYSLTSIHLIIAGRRNKQKAISVSLIKNKIPVAALNAISFKYNQASL